MLGMVAVPVLLSVIMGVLLVATPWLMPPTECFAVTVPPSAKDDPRIRALYRIYSVTVGTTTVLCVIACSVVMHLWASDPSSVQSERAFVVTTMVATFVPLIVSFALMLHTRNQVRELKESERWVVEAPHAAAFVDDDAPKPISIWWNVLYLVIAAALAAFALAHFADYPARIPMQVDFDGTITRFADKSVRTVLFPAFFAALLGTAFTFAHYVSIHSKRPIDPAAPASSALAYGRFARVYSLMSLLGGLGLCTIFGISFNLSVLGTITLGQAAVIMVVTTLIFVVAVTGVSVVMGQSGALLASELRTTDAVLRDDDAHWLLGTIYFNPQDPSIFVPKRFGIGWTCNAARPEAWGLMAALVLLVAVFTLVMA